MLHAQDPVDLRKGDELVTRTEIRRGAIVAFQRTGPSTVEWGTLSPDAQAAWDGFLYRVDKGESGQMVFVPVRTGPGGPPVGDAQRLVMSVEPPEPDA